MKMGARGSDVEGEAFSLLRCSRTPAWRSRGNPLHRCEASKVKPFWLKPEPRLWLVACVEAHSRATVGHRAGRNRLALMDMFWRVPGATSEHSQVIWVGLAMNRSLGKPTSALPDNDKRRKRGLLRVAAVGAQRP